MLSSSPRSSIAFTTRPISWSVCAAKAANTSIWRANSLFSSARQLVPVLDGVGFGRELRVLRDDAHLLLAGEGLFAVLVPAAVELALVLRDPVLRHVMRGVRGAGGEVGEERLVRGQRLLAPDPLDGLVRHVGGEVVVRVVRHLDLDGAVVDQRRPLIGLAADEAVELVEAGMRGPAIERSGHADFPRRRLVILAEGGRAVAVLAQDLGQRRDALRPRPGVARERGRHFHDRARVVRMVVAAGQEGHARRRAERRRVEPVVLEPLAGQTIERRHGNGAAERARVAEPDVVDQEDDDVRRALGRLHLEPRRRLGLARVQFGLVRIVRLRNRQHRAIDVTRRLRLRAGASVAPIRRMPRRQSRLRYQRQLTRHTTCHC